jgi:hypothetical protein
MVRRAWQAGKSFSGGLFVNAEKDEAAELICRFTLLPEYRK